MTEEFPFDVFLSHSSKDIARAGAVHVCPRLWLKQASDNGRKPVRTIVFTGERFDVMSVRRWRDRALAAYKTQG